jgi:hypothetical protein
MTHMEAMGRYVKEIGHVGVARVSHGMAEVKLLCFRWLSPFLKLPAYEDGTECSETVAYKIQTPGNYSEESTQDKKWKITKFYKIKWQHPEPCVYGRSMVQILVRSPATLCSSVVLISPSSKY